MNLRSRLNSIEKRISEIKTEQDDSAFVRTGVWHANRQTGQLIEGSGVVSRVRREQVNSFGVLLMPEPCQTHEEFADEIERCNEYQRTLNQSDE